MVWTDGTCTIRWRTEFASTSVWKSFEEAMKVHGHFEPRYNTELRWIDAPDSVVQGLQEAAKGDVHNLGSFASDEE